MNPLSPLTTALVAGATNAANPVVAPAYEALKALISRQLAGLPTADEAELALALFERKPDDENRQQMLQSILEAAGLHQRPELIASAQQLLVPITLAFCCFPRISRICANKFARISVIRGKT